MVLCRILYNLVGLSRIDPVGSFFFLKILSTIDYQFIRSFVSLVFAFYQPQKALVYFLTKFLGC